MSAPPQLHQSTPTSPALPDPTERFDLALSRMYAAFNDIDFQPEMLRFASVTAADMSALAEPPADLTPEIVARFVVKAGTTWGGPDDMRRITPRALELAANHQLAVDRGLFWAKLRWSDPPAWPTYQGHVVREFVLAEWFRLLCSPPRPAHVAHRWLADFANYQEDLSSHLQEWARLLGSPTPEPFRRVATGHLVILLCHSPLRPDFPDTVSQLFPGHREAAETVAQWLASHQTLVKLQGANSQLAHTSDSRRIRTALVRLERFQSRYSSSN